jgi:hypothetical protein
MPMVDKFGELLELIGKGLVTLVKKVFVSSDRLKRWFDRSLGFYCPKCDRYDVYRKFIGMENVSESDGGITTPLIRPVWEVTCPECGAVFTVRSPF